MKTITCLCGHTVTEWHEENHPDGSLKRRCWKCRAEENRAQLEASRQRCASLLDLLLEAKAIEQKAGFWPDEFADRVDAALKPAAGEGSETGRGK